MAIMNATTALTDFYALLCAPWPDGDDDHAARVDELDAAMVDYLDAIVNGCCNPADFPGLTEEQRAILAVGADVWAERLSEDDLHRLMREPHDKAQDAVRRGDRATAYLHGYVAMLADMVDFGEVPSLGEVLVPGMCTGAQERVAAYLAH